ncbi:hypothetical protein ABB37_10137 [Leptomonas pyrrhocoris]|uniref:Uncharacterized protein n=1 Tax=Leptomonas pyrrhocoris TaxID=157538 RepID=A0A0N0VCJ8_LEPPY|nr:hypothetical protein ABB37_10137 [Leptomonas pyrrhocoris]KPA73078.1 hypothetical protein ABB37_10137 [Leptomonas pyrrhocoris]|eukprot:XP_015651517.1 hypothetical protein ABB37_10137 [Leptomonas pyrrhocoris]
MHDRMPTNTATVVHHPLTDRPSLLATAAPSLHAGRNALRSSHAPRTNNVVCFQRSLSTCAALLVRSSHLCDARAEREAELLVLSLPEVNAHPAARVGFASRSSSVADAEVGARPLPASVV